MFADNPREDSWRRFCRRESLAPQNSFNAIDNTVKSNIITQNLKHPLSQILYPKSSTTTVSVVYNNASSLSSPELLLQNIDKEQNIKSTLINTLWTGPPHYLIQFFCIKFLAQSSTWWTNEYLLHILRVIWKQRLLTYLAPPPSFHY